MSRMSRMKAPAFRVTAIAALALTLLVAAPLPSSPGQAPRALLPLAGEDPPPLTPVLDPAPREPRPELRFALATAALKGNS